MDIVQALASGGAAESPGDLPLITGPFIFCDLPLTANTQDLYLARASIRKALSSDLPKFLGAFLDIGSGLQQYLRLLNAAPSCVEQCKSLNTLRDTSGAIWQQKLGTAYRRVVELMEENMAENPSSGHDVRTWFRAYRMLPDFTLVRALEQMTQWSLVSDDIDATYYLYILHFIAEREGIPRSAQAAQQYIAFRVVR